MNIQDVSLYIKRGITPKYTQDGYCVINQKCIRNNRINYEFIKRTSVDKKYDPEKFLKPFDILINSTGAGTLGRVALFMGSEEPTLVDSHVTILRVSEDYPSIVLAYFLYAQEGYIGTLGKGSTNQLELSRDTIAQLEIPSLEPEAMKEMASLLLDYNKLILNYSRQIACIEEMVGKTCSEWFKGFIHL